MARVQLPEGFARLTAKSNFEWSDDQERIFEWFEEGSGNLVVRARAGTAKTTSILEGVERAPERRILLAAFNKAIAEELQGRARNPNVRVQTLHALGLSFCRRRLDKLDVDTHNERARALAKMACEAMSMRDAGRKNAPSDIVHTVAGLHTKIREILVDPWGDFGAAFGWEDVPPKRSAEFWEDMESFALKFGFEGHDAGYWSLGKVVEAALQAIEAAKEPTNTIDFADMIFLPIIHHWMSPVCDLLVVDEAQDMSEPQLRLALGAVKPFEVGGRVCVVGDEKQAIYEFRGADVDSLDRLKTTLQARELGLKTTYRCPQAVVEVARAFAPDFTAAPAASAGEVHKIDSEKLYKLAQPGDFVLSRVNAPLARICLELIRAGKVAYVKGADIGKRLARVLEKLEYLDDCGSLPKLTKTLGKWYKAEKKKLDKCSGKVIEEKLSRLNEQHDLIEAFIEGADSIHDFHRKVESCFADTKGNAIMCSTVHKAKGLEASNVFLIGATFSRATDEESNICYVAATRAKERLYLVGKSVAEFKRGLGTTPRSEMEAIEQYLNHRDCEGE